jgi:hypothetical protein
MPAALTGNLEAFGVAEIFQLIGQQRKTGTLDVSHGDQTLRLAFDGGYVVWARPVGKDGTSTGERLVRCGLLTQERLEELRVESEVSARPVPVLAVQAEDVTSEAAGQIEEMLTHETIFMLLRWSKGSFDFSAQPVKHDCPPEKLLAAEQILMEGLRMVDEWQTFAALVPEGETIFERNPALDLREREVAGEAKNSRASVDRVYGLVDGRLTAQRIIDLSRLGLFDATRALAELHRDEAIVPVSKRQTRTRPRDSDRSLRPVGEQARGWLAVALPLALLSLVVFSIVRGEASRIGPPVFPIVRTPLEDARGVFEKRRLRHVLEARRLLSGSWPVDLSGPDPTGLLEGDTLTAAHGEPYYYARRGGSIVLLAPGN